MSKVSAIADGLARWAGLALAATLLAGPSGPGPEAGVAVAAPMQTPSSQTNYALEFDGSDALVDLSATPIGEPASVTVEVWARIDAPDRFQILLTHARSDFNDGFTLLITDDNRLGFGVVSSAFFKATAIGSTELEVGEWYHLAGSFDPGPGVVKVFVNGVEDGSENFNGAIRYLDGRDLLLASQHKSFMRSMRFFHGALDEIRIWDHARSPAELGATLEYELAGDEAGLLGYWRLNEGEGTTTADASGADNPGSLSGGPKWIEAPWRKTRERLVTIDIKPGDSDNVVATHSHGKIPVALLSSAEFDAVLEVDRSTLTFGTTGDEESLGQRGRGRTHCRVEDVNGDGHRDLVCMFEARHTQLGSGDTKAVLKGAMNGDGTRIRGEDRLRPVRRRMSRH